MSVLCHTLSRESDITNSCFSYLSCKHILQAQNPTYFYLAFCLSSLLPYQFGEKNFKSQKVTLLKQEASRCVSHMLIRGVTNLTRQDFHSCCGKQSKKAESLATFRISYGRPRNNYCMYEHGHRPYFQINCFG